VRLGQLCPTSGPVKGFERPSLCCSCDKSILHTGNLSLFWYFGFEIFDAGGPQCYFITSTIAVRIRTLSVHHLKM